MSNDPLAMLAMSPQMGEKPQPIEIDTHSNEDLIKRSQQDGEWHYSILRLTKRLFEQGRSDEEIHAITDDLTTAGYTVEETRKEVQKMVDGARKLPSTKVAQVDKQIKMLAQMLDTQYALERKDLAEDIGMTAGHLDDLIKKKQHISVKMLGRVG